MLQDEKGLIVVVNSWRKVNRDSMRCQEIQEDEKKDHKNDYDR